MNVELKEEIIYEISLLVKSGFYAPLEINEIIEEQFLDEDVNLNQIDLIVKEELEKHIEDLKDCKFNFFRSLNNSFIDLTKKNIVPIHNAGFDFEEGVNDAFEIYTHLVNNKYDAKGFVFYSFYDIEDCINDNELYLTFGDYKQNKKLALKIGNEIVDSLKFNNLNVKWDGSLDERICIKPFKWMKHFDEDFTYGMEGAVETYIKINLKD